MYKDGRLIKTSSFGDQRYQQYKDRTPLQLYKAGDHLDERRRALYHKRHNYKAKKYSSGWFSKNYLWWIFVMYYTKHVYLDTNWVGVAYHRRFRGGGARAKNRVPKSVYFLLLWMRRTKGN